MFTVTVWLDPNDPESTFEFAWKTQSKEGTAFARTVTLAAGVGRLASVTGPNKNADNTRGWVDRIETVELEELPCRVLLQLETALQDEMMKGRHMLARANAAILKVMVKEENEAEFSAE